MQMQAGHSHRPWEEEVWLAPAWPMSSGPALDSHGRLFSQRCFLVPLALGMYASPHLEYAHLSPTYSLRDAGKNQGSVVRFPGSYTASINYNCVTLAKVA